MTKDEIPTPALLVDVDLLETNLQTMTEHCRWHRCAIRPHAKSHKSPDIAKKQIAAGAIGISVATVAEAEAMVAADLPGVLLTSPVVEIGKIRRMVDLCRKRQDILLAVGHPLEVELLAEAAEAQGVTVHVLLDLDVGDKRTGILPDELSLNLAQFIGRFPSLRLEGLQAYAGHASHVVGLEARAQASRAALTQALAARERLIGAGLAVNIMSCGSTGTYNIDSSLAGVTEIQPGSYVFMDLDYHRIGGPEHAAAFDEFVMSLTVLTTVVSTTYGNRFTVDAGIKAFATDVPIVPVVKGVEGLTYRFAGDEFGIVSIGPGGHRPRLGERLEMFVPHCDPTVNLYDRLYAMRGSEVEAVWPIAHGR